jgi:nicotinamide-nucleotide amidase
MRAEIVSVGTELLLGTITDTNATYLAQRLASLGIDCYYVSQVGDNLGRLVETLGRALERSDLIVTTGGLGPTQDDLTREAISSLLDEEMVVSPPLEAELRSRFARRGSAMPEPNLKQATLIPSAQPLQNPVGTAPGWWVTARWRGSERVIVAMPGVPFEMRRMWEEEVEPRIGSVGRGTIVSRTLKVLGMGESAVAEKVADLMTGANPTLAPYAKQDGVHLRISVKAADEASAEPIVANMEQQVRERLGDAVYGMDDDTPHGVVLALLRERGYSLSLLELGSPAAGALAPLARGIGPGKTPVTSVLSVPEASALERVLGTEAWSSDCNDFDCSVRILHDVLGVDVTLAVNAALDWDESQRGTATAYMETLAIVPGEGEDLHLTRARQTWKTDPGEVPRLLNLMACNLLRLILLRATGQGS